MVLLSFLSAGSGFGCLVLAVWAQVKTCQHPFLSSSRLVLLHHSPENFFKWTGEANMALHPRYLLFFKLCILLFMSVMPALIESVGEEVVLTRGVHQRLPHHESNGIELIPTRSLTMPGSALHRRGRSRWLGPHSRRDSSLRVSGIIAAALAAVFIVLICFQKVKETSTGSARPRNLDGGRDKEKLPPCPVGRPSC